VKSHFLKWGCAYLGIIIGLSAPHLIDAYTRKAAAAPHGFHPHVQVGPYIIRHDDDGKCSITRLMRSIKNEPKRGRKNAFAIFKITFSLATKRANRHSIFASAKARLFRITFSNTRSVTESPNRSLVTQVPILKLTCETTLKVTVQNWSQSFNCCCGNLIYVNSKERRWKQSE
jgi:hypothetical protein